jgi:hypothetical protein
MADAHVDVQRFDFHAGNLTTARRAEASSEGGMKTEETQIFRAKVAKLAKGKFSFATFATFARLKNQADNSSKRARLGTKKWPLNF